MFARRQELISAIGELRQFINNYLSPYEASPEANRIQKNGIEQNRDRERLNQTSTIFIPSRSLPVLRWLEGSGHLVFAELPHGKSTESLIRPAQKKCKRTGARTRAFSRKFPWWFSHQTLFMPEMKWRGYSWHGPQDSSVPVLNPQGLIHQISQEGQNGNEIFPAFEERITCVRQMTYELQLCNSSFKLNLGSFIALMSLNLFLHLYDKYVCFTNINRILFCAIFMMDRQVRWSSG